MTSLNELFDSTNFLFADCVNLIEMSSDVADSSILKTFSSFVQPLDSGVIVLFK